MGINFYAQVGKWSGVVLLLLAILAQHPAVRADQVASPIQENEFSVLTDTKDLLDLSLRVPTYAIKNSDAADGFQQLVVPNASFSDAPGNPNLPSFQAWVGIPVSGDPTLEILSADGSVLPGTHKIVPVGKQMTSEDDFTAGEVVFRPNVESYAMTESIPSSVAALGDVVWERDQRFVSVSVSPFQYIPSTGKLTYYPEIRIRIAFPDSSVAQISPTGQTFGGLAETALNAATAKQWQKVGASRGSSLLAASASSVRYRLPVTVDGIYKVSGSDLASAGLTLPVAAPYNFELSVQGQAVAIWVQDGGDGQFGSTDSITFYGEKFRGDRFAALFPEEDDEWLDAAYYWPEYGLDPAVDKMSLSQHFEMYNSPNVYWLTVGSDTPSPAMSVLSATLSGATTASSYRATTRAEQQIVAWTHHFTSSDYWLWERINTITGAVTKNYTVSLDGIVGTGNASLHAEIVARNYVNITHLTNFKFNAAAMSNQSWTGRRRLLVDGTVTPVNGTNTLTLDVSSLNDVIYMDWFSVTYDRQFLATSDALSFTQGTAGTWAYSVNGFTSSTTASVFDVTNPLAPKRIGNAPIAVSGGIIPFSAQTTNSSAIVVAGNTAIKTFAAGVITKYTEPNIKSCASARDYVVIAPVSFVSTIASSPLITQRNNQGLTTAVVSIDDLYNTYTYGIQNPVAIREYLRWYFASSCAQKPQYVMLVGDGHWNFISASGYEAASTILLAPNYHYVDPWQGQVDSTTLLASVSGTDYIPDVHIGRLPARNIAEFQAYVSKMLNYENAPSSDVANQHLFVADNADAAGAFEAISDAVASDIVHPFPAAQITKVYVSDYCTGTGTCSAITAALVNQLNGTGAALLSYTGHGALQSWASEKVLQTSDMSKFNNLDRLPVVISLDCLDGYYHFPGTQSLAEELILATNGGAVGTFSPGGLGLASGHDILHRAFYNSALYDPQQRLGVAADAAKMALYQNGSAPDVVLSYTVFGDPALRMRLGLPNRVYIPLVIR